MKPGSIIVTEAGRNIVGRFLKWAQKSRWTHVVLVTGEDEYIEAMAFRGVRKGKLSELSATLRSEVRAYIGLDCPALTDAERQAIVAAANTYVGRRYDYLQAVLYFFTGGFFRDGELRVICSRLVTAAYYDGARRIQLFDNERVEKLSSARREDLHAGYCTPDSLLWYSSLTIQAAERVFPLVPTL